MNVDATWEHLGAELEADAAKAQTAYEEAGMEWLPNWFLGKLAELDARDATLDEQFGRLRKANDAQRKALWWRYGREFQAQVNKDLQGSTKKSVDYHYGRAGYRKLASKTKLVVDDEDAAAAHAELFCPNAVRKTLLTGKLYEHMQANGGELPPGCRLDTSEAREQFYPKPIEVEKGEDDD